MGARSVGLVLGALLWAACDGDGTGPVVVRSVVVMPADTTIMVGETLQLRAEGRDASGAAVSGLSVTWSGGSTAVATLSGSGLLTATGVGQVELTATVGGVGGTARVEVEADDPEPGPGPEPGPVASVTLDRMTVTLDEGGTTTLVATPRDAEGRVVTGRVVQWTSTKADIARVGVFGEVTAVKVGATEIRARVDGASATAEVTVDADYGYDLVYDLSEEVGSAPALFRLAIRDPEAEPVRIYPGRHAMDAAVSPTGDRLAFRVYVSGGSEIWVANLDGGDSLKVASAPGWFMEAPSWSPDGTRIAYHAWSLDTPALQIWVVNADGTAPVNLTADQEGGSKQGPAWSPDREGGARIAYTRMHEGQAHLWTMRPDGSDKTQVTTGNVADIHPAWSPDGQRLAFERYGAPGSLGGDVWTVQASGASPSRLVDLPLGQFDPTWSPDGRMIAFSSGITSELQIFTVWTDGTKLAQRTRIKRPHERPTWLPR